MNNWKTVLLVVVAIILSGIGGYRLGVHRTKSLAQLCAVQPVMVTIRNASEAYQDQKPEIAIWALQQAISQMEAQLALDVENPWLKHQQLQCDIMLAHARIARKYEALHDGRSEDHVRMALEFSRKAYPTESIDRDGLFKFLKAVDANSSKGSPQGGGEKGSPPLSM